MMPDHIDFTSLLNSSKRKAKSRVSSAKQQISMFEYELEMAKRELEYAEDDLYKIERFSRIYDAPREVDAPPVMSKESMGSLGAALGDAARDFMDLAATSCRAKPGSYETKGGGQ